MQNIVEMSNEHRFNIRVYGILVNDRKEVLISKERRRDFKFTKFPGGGLNWGEGSRDCIKREIREELGLEISIKNMFYLTEHFQESAFRKEDQLISIYYWIDSNEKDQIEDGMESKDPAEEDNRFYWQMIEDLNLDQLTFPIDREVAKLLKSKFQ